MTIKISNKIKVILIITALSFISYDSLHASTEFKDRKKTLADNMAMGGSSNTPYKYDDGPYTSIEKNILVEKTIAEGKVISNNISLKDQIVNFHDELSVFKDIQDIAAISDIHGQHDVFINILKTHNIIDSDLNWSFGDGHFVITGDIFDRGPQVLDALWFIFDLEKQAKKAGGKVHYLLGNHEYMVLHGRTKYLHSNYLKTAELLETEYKDLFDNTTILGRWIRSKSTVIKINDSIFLHGGISSEFLEHKLDLDTINQRYRETIDLTRKSIKKNSNYKMLHNSTSPIWYRGYFRDGGLNNAEVDHILNVFDASRIIVGHTSGDTVRLLNDGRIYGIDASIKKGLKGEILLLLGKEIYRGTYKGKKIRLK